MANTNYTRDTRVAFCRVQDMRPRRRKKAIKWLKANGFQKNILMQCWEWKHGQH